MEETKRKMILDWMRKIHTLEYAHRFESVKWNSFNNWFGIPSIIIAAFIGAIGSVCEIKDLLISSLFTTIGGVSVAILTGLQTFLRPIEVAEKHRIASSIYERLRHKIEFLLEFKSNTVNIDSEIENIRSEWIQIDALNVSTSNFNRAKKKIRSFNKYPEELGFLNNVTTK